MSSRAAVACAALLLCCSFGAPARADEIVSIRATSSYTLGPDLAAWDAGYGAAWDAWLDVFGLRLGGNLGMLSYVGSHTTPGYLIGTPEAALAFGQDNLRLYCTLELPLPLLELEVRHRGPWYEHWFLGVRSGAELEQRMPSLDLRVRAGLFMAALRDEHGVVRQGFTLRVTVEYGAPTIAAPPAMKRERLCGDGTPRLPGMPCGGEI